MSDVAATVNYIIPGKDRGLQFMVDNISQERIEKLPLMNWKPDPRLVMMEDARLLNANLQHDGFELRCSPISAPDNALYDSAWVWRHYHNYVRGLLMSRMNARCVHIYDSHTRRTNNLRSDREKEQWGPSVFVHNDQTHLSASRRVLSYLKDYEGPDDPMTLLRGNWAVVNVWRPIGDVVRNWPLALCHQDTTAMFDFIPVDLVMNDYVEEVYNGRHNPYHRWFYYPDMTPDETILFMICSNRNQKMGLHTSFPMTEGPYVDAERRSIEVRALVFF